MTRVDFYILQAGSAQARLTAACRLAEKAVAHQHRVLINSDSDADTEQLDKLLWTFSQGSFLPHRRLGDGASDEREPILLGSGEEPGDDDADLLINLAVAVPAFSDRFSRIAELVGSDDTDKQAGRARFRYYRDRGHELLTHNI